MGKARKEGKAIDIWKRKRWYQLIAPKTFRETVLGETPALEPEMVVGREATLSLMAVTNDMKKQNINVSFVVEKVTGDKAFTEFRKYELSPAFIKRMVRRGRDRIDEVLTLHTADKVKITLKPFVITNGNTSSSVLGKLRKAVSLEIKKRVEYTNFNELVSLIVARKIQSEVYSVLNKIYPLRNMEIRMFEAISFDERTEEVEIKREEIEQPKEEKEEEISDEDIEEKPIKAKKAKAEKSKDTQDE